MALDEPVYLETGRQISKARDERYDQDQDDREEHVPENKPQTAGATGELNMDDRGVIRYHGPTANPRSLPSP